MQCCLDISFGLNRKGNADRIMSSSSTDTIEVLLDRWGQGDSTALDELMPLVYEELYRVAASYLRREPPSHILEPTALVNEAYMQLATKHTKWQNRAHFFGISANIMRRILINYARESLTLNRSSGASTAVEPQTSDQSMVELLAMHEALERLEKADLRVGRIVELRYFGGLTIKEIAQVMAISPSTAERCWRLGRVWLRRELSGGSPSAEASAIFVQSPSVFAEPSFPTEELTDDDFFALCQENRDLQIERTKEGELIIMPPTGGEAGIRNAKLISRFGEWAERDGSGQSFDSSTGFLLPDRAVRSPDLSWLLNHRWNALSEKDKEQFPPLCPDFVVELRSKTDSLKKLQDKMEEYIANGAQLGWLIDPIERKVHIYGPGVAAEVLDNPETVSGEPLLKGFALDVRTLWD